MTACWVARYSSAVTSGSACNRTSSSPGPGFGTGRSSTLTDSGRPSYAVRTTARIVSGMLG